MTIDGTTSPLARLIDRRVEELKGVKSQKQIAKESGFANPNMITILKNGVAKVSLDRVVPLAVSLGIDPATAFRLAVLQYVSPEALAQVESLFGRIVSDNELEILEYIREKSGQTDPKLNDRFRKALDTAFD